MTCSLLFVTPYDADTRLVDLATGRHGYGHVAIWGGHVGSRTPQFPDGEPVVFDAGIGYGVGFRALSIACPAPFRELKLDQHLGRWIWRRAVACAGSEYDYAGLIRGRKTTDRFTCSGLVACALPEHMRSALPKRVSPNDLARYFKVPAWR